MESLASEDVAPLTPAANSAMLSLILAWARYDALVGQWLAIAYHLPMDDGTLLIGNMDTKTKLDRLKAIYLHHQMASAAKSVERLLKTHLDLRHIRNHVAHSVCIGVLKSDPAKVIFLPFKANKGSAGQMAVHEVLIQDMNTAAAFAAAVFDELNTFNGKQREQNVGPPPEPPVFE